MRMHVAFTPAEAAAAPGAIVVDVLRATSTIAQALGSGYRRVLCCGEIEEGRALREEVGEGLLGSERVGILDGSDAAIAAELIAASFADAQTALNARTYGSPGLEDDIAWCARESVLDVVPRFTGMVGSAAEIVA